MASFGSLYDYNQGNGTVSVIPDTSSVKTKIVDAFVSIFGEDLDTSSQTAIGRIIEALTLLFVDVLGVNAQNANSFNPNQALGTYLDSIGKIFGLNRLSGESDAAFRSRIMKSQSRGSGYVQSIRQAVGNVEGVTSVCVLENGEGDVAVVDGIALPAHSIYVCVGGSNYDQDDVAEAIYSTKSAGCGYQIDPSHGALVTRTVTDSHTGSSNVVKFHQAAAKQIEVAVTVNGAKYTGNDIVATVKSTINSVVAENSTNSTLTSVMIASAISASGTGIICTSASLTSGHTAEDPVVTLPYQYITLSDSDISVTVQ